MQYGAAWTIGSSYDANGNLTSDGSTSFTYDMENRLVAASGAKGANLRYDPLGRLYEVNGPFGLTRFIYDGDHVAAEYNSAGTVLRRYMWGPGADEPILWDEGSAVNCSGGKFLQTDRQGSVVAAADCWGNRIAVNRYDEYGIPQSGNTGRFQYTGQAWLPELGMYYYKARIYSPTLGRFMQTDPIGYKDQFNLYAYVGNDPVNLVDPDGQYGWLVKLVNEGVKRIAKVSRKDAVRSRRAGQNVQARTRQEARQIERQVSNDPAKLKRHQGHELKDGDGNLTGEKGRPHYQTSGKQGHTFWSVAGALAILGKGLDAVDQLTNPLYTTELGDGTCSSGGCGSLKSIPASEKDQQDNQNGWSIDGSAITGTRGCASRLKEPVC